jgi:hypothetical protein
MAVGTEVRCSETGDPHFAMLLWWLLLVLGVAVVAEWHIGASAARGRRYTNRAHKILEERFARGEVGKLTRFPHPAQALYSNTDGTGLWQGERA